MRSNREYDYFGNVLEYDYFASYASTSTSPQKVLVLEYEYEYTSRITPSLDYINTTNNSLFRSGQSYIYIEMDKKHESTFV